jgi:hypothetical protein
MPSSRPSPKRPEICDVHPNADQALPPEPRLWHGERWRDPPPLSFLVENTPFPSDHVADAAAGLAVLGMRLLPLQRFESVQACAKAIAVIADRAVAVQLTNFYPVADILTFSSNSSIPRTRPRRSAACRLPSSFAISSPVRRPSLKNRCRTTAKRYKLGFANSIAT